jgi:hypothetical protein
MTTIRREAKQLYNSARSSRHQKKMKAKHRQTSKLKEIQMFKTKNKLGKNEAKNNHVGNLRRGFHGWQQRLQAHKTQQELTLVTNVSEKKFIIVNKFYENRRKVGDDSFFCAKCSHSAYVGHGLTAHLMQKLKVNMQVD